MYRACVALDPTDDELHYGLSRCYAQMGASAMARESLVTALSLYPPSPKLQVALGLLLLKRRRTRAALRRFENTLSLSADPSEEETTEARMHAGLCLLRLAQAHRHRAAALLPRAEARLGRALADHAEGEFKRQALEELLGEAAALRAQLGARRPVCGHVEACRRSFVQCQPGCICMR